VWELWVGRGGGVLLHVFGGGGMGGCFFVFVFLCVFFCVYLFVCMCMCVCACVCVCVCACMCIYVCLCARLMFTETLYSMWMLVLTSEIIQTQVALSTEPSFCVAVLIHMQNTRHFSFHVSICANPKFRVRSRKQSMLTSEVVNPTGLGKRGSAIWWTP